MIQLIPPQLYYAFLGDIQEMHRLRYRVFKQRLDWDVVTENGLEVDRFDRLEPHYLFLRADDGRIDGCVRFLPSTGPTMIRDEFAELLDGAAAPCDASIWESSRFAIDRRSHLAVGEGGLAGGTYELLAGMIEFGLSRNLSNIVTVTDLRMERVLRRAGWPLERLGAPRPIGTTTAVAGLLPVDATCLGAIRKKAGLSSPVLWAPVIPAMA